MKNKISFRIEREDGEVELFLKIDISGFSGESSAFFSKKNLDEFIENASRYPIDVASPPVLSGGYWDQGEGGIVQENLHVSFMPKGNRGQIDLTIRLAIPTDENPMKIKCSCFANVETTYAGLSTFIEKFCHSISEEAPENSFEYPFQEIY
jgi:hypothetical protein